MREAGIAALGILGANNLRSEIVDIDQKRIDKVLVSQYQTRPPESGEAAHIGLNAVDALLMGLINVQGLMDLCIANSWC
jgi:hypothetical protein